MKTDRSIVAIARALMTNPDLLLMDKPSEGLAPLIVSKIGQIISQLKESGFSILLVEQNYPMALKVADYAYIISKGIIVHESTIEELRRGEETRVKYLCATE
jgi:branched-chain amino acid transport system ATP-binding protein